MALNGTILAALIETNLIAKGFAVTHSGGGVDLADFADAIANAIVTHIISSAIVTTTLGAPDSEHTGIIT